MLLTASIVVLLCGAVVLQLDYVNSRAALVRLIDTVARMAAENVSAAVAFQDAKTAQEIVAALRTEPQVLGAAVVDADGKLLVSYSAGAPMSVPRGAFEGSTLATEQGFVAVHAIEQDGRRLGTLYVHASTATLKARTWNAIWTAALIFAGAMALAGVLATWLGRRLAQPILQLAHTADRIAEGEDFSLRANESGSDELGKMGGAFNRMVVKTSELIARLRESEAEHRNLAERAIAAGRAKDDFLAALSHELRTPLTPVLLLATEEAQNPEFPPAVRDSFDFIAKNVALEARLIDDLLDLTAITRGKLRIERQVVDVYAILKDALRTLSQEFSTRKIELKIHLDAGDAAVLGDAVRLQQVYWNLLKNAVKFTPEGGVVAVESRTEKKLVVVQITDTGIGLTEKELSHLFEAFVQGEHQNTHRFGGLGLGLAISRRLAELHGGTLHATSEGRGKGATFVVALPRAVR